MDNIYFVFQKPVSSANIFRFWSLLTVWSILDDFSIATSVIITITAIAYFFLKPKSSHFRYYFLFLLSLILHSLILPSSILNPLVIVLLSSIFLLLFLRRFSSHYPPYPTHSLCSILYKKGFVRLKLLLESFSIKDWKLRLALL